MKKETLKRIFEFLQEKENNNPPFKWKLINNEPLTKEELNVEGSLNLSYSKITQLPKGLEVGGNLYLREVDLEKYTDEELREMVKPGFIKEKIYRQ